MIQKETRVVYLKFIFPTPLEKIKTKFYELNYVKGLSNMIVMSKKPDVRNTWVISNNVSKFLPTTKKKSNQFKNWYLLH